METAATNLPVLPSTTKTAVKAWVKNLSKVGEDEFLAWVEPLGMTLRDQKELAGLYLHVANDRLLPAEYSAVLATLVERSGVDKTTLMRWRREVQERYGLARPAAQVSRDTSASRTPTERTPVRDEVRDEGEEQEGEVFALTGQIIDANVAESPEAGKSPDRIRAAVFLIPIFGAETIAEVCQLGDVRAAHDELGKALALMEAPAAEEEPDVVARGRQIAARMRNRRAG